MGLGLRGIAFTYVEVAGQIGPSTCYTMLFNAGDSMIAKTRNPKIRKRIIKHHRRQKFEEAFDLLLQGKVDPGYVKLRGNKLTELYR